MNNATDTNTIKFTRGNDWVRFEMTEPEGLVSLSNSHGEAYPLEWNDAAERIQGLVADKEWSRA